MACPFDLIQTLPDGDLLIGKPGAGYWRLSEELARLQECASIVESLAKRITKYPVTILPICNLDDIGKRILAAATLKEASL